MRIRKIQNLNPKKVLLDSSGIIDARLLKLTASGFVNWHMVVTNYVLEEIQMLADTGSRIKRQRARAGLDMLAEIQKNDNVKVEVLQVKPRNDIEVDQRLINEAIRLKARLYTTDFNLDRNARVHGIEVLNVNQLMLDLRVEYLAGDTSEVKIVQKGSEKGQGVGFSDDGTMIVVSDASKYIGKDISVVFDNSVQTESGRILFAKVSPKQPPVTKRQPAKKSTDQTARKLDNNRKQQPQNSTQTKSKPRPTNTNSHNKKPVDRGSKPQPVKRKFRSKSQIEQALLDTISNN